MSDRYIFVQASKPQNHNVCIVSLREKIYQPSFIKVKIMLQSIEGVYKNGKIELTELPLDVSESLVIVTFLESKKTQQSKQIMQFGMFSGNQQSTETNFQIAEFHGDKDDSLDWS